MPSKKSGAKKPKVTKYTVHARSGLNLRRDPCMADGNVIQILPHGTVVEWDGANEGDWYHVRLTDKTEGYVLKTYLRSL